MRDNKQTIEVYKGMIFVSKKLAIHVRSIKAMKSVDENVLIYTDIPENNIVVLYDVNFDGAVRAYSNALNYYCKNR